MSRELRYDDRVVVVTGAGRGVGRCHALLFAAKGARVVVADHGAGLDGSGTDAVPAESVVREIEGTGGEAVPVVTSVATEEGALAVVEKALDTWGRIDAVVNNAGIHDPGRFDQLAPDQFRRMIDVHYLGTVLVTQAAWPHFVAAGYGRVVNTVSEAMLGGLPELASYGAAKGAVWGLTRNLATEGSALGIRVNALAPRAFTRMSASAADDLQARLGISKADMDAINASMPPEMCAPAAAFLAHESCSLNGEVLQIGMGAVNRIAVVNSQGLAKAALTAEDIAENVDSILDLTDPTVREVVSLG